MSGLTCGFLLAFSIANTQEGDTIIQKSELISSAQAANKPEKGSVKPIQPSFLFPSKSDLMPLMPLGKKTDSFLKLSKSIQPSFTFLDRADLEVLQKKIKARLFTLKDKNIAILKKSEKIAKNEKSTQAIGPLVATISTQSDKKLKEIIETKKTAPGPDAILPWQDKNSVAMDWDLSMGMWRFDFANSDDSSRASKMKDTKKQSPKTAAALDPFSEPATRPSDPTLKREYPYLLPQRLSLRNRQKRGIGYKHGYWSLDGLFGPDAVSGRLLPLLDVRGHRFVTGEFAANVGFVGRWIPKTGPVIMGFNAYYDWREGCQRNQYQVGGGVEFLGTWWDVRLNGYFPLGEQLKFVLFTQHYPGGFEATWRSSQRVFSAGDMEVGVTAIKTSDFILYAAASPYFIHSPHVSSWGAKARIRPQYRDMVALDISVSRDQIFKTIFQMELMLTVPLYQVYPKKNPRHSRFTERQMYQPVERFEIIPMKCKPGSWSTNYLGG